MICPNCNAEIKETDLLCPYCGYENSEIALKQHEDEMDATREAISEEKKRPERAEGKVKKSVKITFIVLGAVFVIAIALAFIIPGILREKSVDTQNDVLEKLEELYNNGDYIGMFDYVKVQEGYFSETYAKYYDLGSIASHYDLREEVLQNMKEAIILGVFSTPEEVGESLTRVFGDLYSLDEMRKKGYVHGEEKGVSELDEKLRTMLKSYTGFTDEEIEEGIAEASKKEKDYSKLAEIFIRNVNEEY